MLNFKICVKFYFAHVTTALIENLDTKVITHNRFTAGLEYVRVHPGQQVPER